MSNVTPVDVSNAPRPGPSARPGLGDTIRTMPAWARWSLMAAIGVFVLSVVQAVSDTSLLTAEGTSSAMLLDRRERSSEMAATADWRIGT